MLKVQTGQHRSEAGLQHSSEEGDHRSSDTDQDHGGTAQHRHPLL